MNDSVSRLKELKKRLKSHIHDDPPYIAMYSTDASPYKVAPLAVATPESSSDVETIVQWAFENNIPIHCRGAGSGLTGSSLGEGIVLDFRSSMNNILSIDAEKLTVDVEPGVVLGELNEALAREGLFFPPDPASGDFCTIGGMIANNSSGARSVKYGATIDYLVQAEAVVPGTGIIIAKKYDKPFSSIDGGKQNNPLTILQKLDSRIKNQISLYEKHLPDAPKNCCGYRLERVFEGDSINLAPLLCGSEGTLAVITKATLNVLPLPEERQVVLLNFSSLKSMSTAVELLLPKEPSAIEIMDHVFLRLVVSKHTELERFVPPGTKAQLLVETDGSPTEAHQKMKDIKGLFSDFGDELLSMIDASTKEEQAQLWMVRKSALPILFTLETEGEITPFIEDVSVSVKNLGTYLEELHTIFERKGIESAVYGHAGEGNLHTRPILNLKTEKDLALMEDLAEEVFALVHRLDGSISGEHGDGRLRTSFLPQFYDEAYSLIEKTKGIFDETNILNPGIIASAEKSSMINSLKITPSYQRKKLPAPLGGSRSHLALEIEKCHGCGTCTTPLTSIPMCPLFKATGLPAASPRGKMAIAQSLLSGDYPKSIEAEEHLLDYLSLCLGCGLCYSYCPSKVNTPQIVNQLRAMIKARKGLPMKDKLLSFLSTPLPWALQPAAALGSLLGNFQTFRKILEQAAGISAKAPLFRFSPLKLSPLYEKGKAHVVYFPDMYAIACKPALGLMTIQLLNLAGYSVSCDPALVSGTPSFAKGDSKAAKATARRTREILTSVLRPDSALVFSEPTAMKTLLEDHQLILDCDNEFTDKLERISTTVVHFLLKALKDGSLKNPKHTTPPSCGKIFYHSPCHLSDTKEQSSAQELLTSCGCEVISFPKRCCGMAGTFGLQSGQAGYETAVKTGAPLFEEIRNSKADVIATECSSCRFQLEHNTGITALHPIELVFNLYKDDFPVAD